MIPVLAFHDAKAPIVNSINLAAEQLGESLPKITTILAKDEISMFRSKTSVISVAGLTIKTTSHTGIHIKREIPDFFDLIIPMQGYISGEAD
jgi:hypothetical protein